MSTRITYLAVTILAAGIVFCSCADDRTDFSKEVDTSECDPTQTRCVAETVQHCVTGQWTDYFDCAVEDSFCITIDHTSSCYSWLTDSDSPVDTGSDVPSTDDSDSESSETDSNINTGQGTDSGISNVIN